MQRASRFLAYGLLLASFAGSARAADDKNLEFITNSIGMKLVHIPAGEFLMGSPESEKARNANGEHEKQHRVKITKPFFLGVYDVTRGQFAQFVADTNYKTEAELDGKGAGGWDAKGDFNFAPKFVWKPEYTWRNPGMFGKQQTDDHPVVAISWNDAQAYCDWLSKTEGKTYRLPTEAEWEYACRAGTTSAFHFGDKLDGENANFNGNYPYPSDSAAKGAFLKCTTPVGTYKPNAFGLYDMHGNVMQWCADWLGSDYFENSPTDDPQGPNAGPLRVVRGSRWTDYADSCRSAFRYGAVPTYGISDIGFRIVLVR